MRRGGRSAPVGQSNFRCPVIGSMTLFGLSRRGLKKFSTRLTTPTGSAMGEPLLLWPGMVLLSKLWPKRKAMVENSVEMVGLTVDW